jgi:hypothetical protein
VSRPSGLGRSRCGCSCFKLSTGRTYPRVSSPRLHEIAPAFDHDFERLQRPARDDRRRDHHAAGHAAVQRQVGAHPKDDNLRDETSEFRCAADPEIPIERAVLKNQGTRLLATPMQNALVQHPHCVDDLRVARERLGMGIRSGSMQARLRQGRRGCLLVQNRNGNEHEARKESNAAETRMNEKHRGEIDGCQRHVEQRSMTGPEMKLLT